MAAAAAVAAAAAECVLPAVYRSQVVSVAAGDYAEPVAAVAAMSWLIAPAAESAA